MQDELRMDGQEYSLGMDSPYCVRVDDCQLISMQE